MNAAGFDPTDGNISPQEALLYMQSLKSLNAPPPPDEELQGLFRVISRREDVPPVMRRIMYGFNQPGNDFSHMDDLELKMERTNLNAAIYLIETSMPRNRLTAEFKLMLLNLKSAYNHSLSKAKKGNLLKGIHTRYNEQGISMPSTEKRGILQQLGIRR